METKPAVIIIAVTSLLAGTAFGANSERVLLNDINVLTLRNGQRTTARRSGSVPQLNCVGGTAGCSTFMPQVVQCYNRGSDGYDAQWECKTDMDNAYRFGRVEVSCEGYDYPEDPYVLRGSCGLEYTLDNTKEGHDQQRQKQHQYYGNQHHDEDYHDRSSSYYDSYSHKKHGSGFGGLLALGAAAFVIYLIYKTCLSGGTPPPATGPSPDNPPPYSRYDSGSQAPPPGFKPEFTSAHSSTGYTGGHSGGFTNPDGCANAGYTNTGYTNTGYTNTGTGTGTGTGGGFWSGMATGGILGYLFGNNTGGYNNGYNSGYYGHTHHRHRPYGSSWGNTGSWFGGSGTGGSWFGGSGTGSTYRPSSGGSFFGGSSSSSSGTRTASGFGGTKRR